MSSSSVAAADTCPNCEFNRRTAGTPRRNGAGLWSCADCGTAWRVVDAASPPVDLPAVGRRRPAWREMVRQIRPDGFIVLAFSVALAFIVLQPFAEHPHPLVKRISELLSDAPLRLETVSARQLETGEGLAVQVEGRLTNHTSKRQPIGDVSITVTESQGQAIYEWTHRPSVAWLEPGESILFRTADGNLPLPGSKVRVEVKGGAEVVRL